MKNFSATLAIVLAGVFNTAGVHAQDTTIARVLRPYATQWEQIVAAEDARAANPAQLDILIGGSRAAEPELRRIAVRALGRLERPDLVEPISRALRDPDPRIRATAANAIGQANSRVDGAAARAALLPLLTSERNPAAIAAIAETLGRTRHNDGAAQTVATLLPLLSDTNPAVRLGAVRGFYFLARQPNARAAIDSTTRTELLRLATATDNAPALVSTRIRTAAASAWVAAARPHADGLGRILEDTSALVRREAASGILALEDTGGARTLLGRAMRDRSGIVRYDAVRVYGRRFGARNCRPVLNAARDSNAHVALLAIDLLGRSCVDTATAITHLDSVARTLPSAENGTWHHAAHALASLAAIGATGQADALLPRFVAHPNFFVRTWAADAAAVLGDRQTLGRLASDVHPNVRTAALQGLSRRYGHTADSIYLAQLRQDDNQLLMTAAVALDSSKTPDVAPKLLDALDRISALKRETMRDSRVAMLQTIRTVGGRSLAPRVQRYLQDYDSAVATIAADLLEKWTDTRPATHPTALPASRLPSFQEAAALSRSTVRIEMADGGVVEMRLLPFAAPANAARFARLAESGHFDALTFHRIAPNFVVQGGSPHANEYAGDGPFTRDELEVENWRGTVGLSTRGRDTGDGQIFINLIDNIRLDHDYTVFAEVVRGMDIVDRLLEGARIRRVMLLD